MQSKFHDIYPKFHSNSLNFRNITLKFHDIQSNVHDNFHNITLKFHDNSLNFRVIQSQLSRITPNLPTCKIYAPHCRATMIEYCFAHLYRIHTHSGGPNCMALPHIVVQL